MQLYKRIELKEGVPVQFVGTYVTRVGHQPNVGFIELAESELAALRDPWQQIDPERPETLPPYARHTKVVITVLIDGSPVSKSGYYDGIQFTQINGSIIPLAVIVAWQPWPAPYGDKTE
jgi:hypothetical protein